MTAATAPVSPTLDFTAAARWPTRAAAHVLGAGLVLAVLAALPAAPTDLDRHQLPKETLAHAATWIAVMLARPFPPRGLRPAALWSLGALMFITGLSTIAASNGWLALRAGSLILTGVAAFITARHLAAIGRGSILLSWCAASGIVGAATGLAHAYGAESPFFAPTRVPGGTFGNRNFMAHFSALALPVLAFVALSTRRRLIAIATTLGCAALVAAIVLSRSRAAWLGTGAGMTILAFACFRARSRQALPQLSGRATLLSGFAAIGVIAAILIPNELSWRSASPYTDTLAGLANHVEGSGRGRMLQYENTMQLAMRHPILGVGPGNWPVRYAEVAPPSDPTWVFGDVVPINPWPSSDWMALASELGLGGVLAALLLAGALLWRGWQGVRASGDRILGGGALLALLIIAFVEGNLDAVLLLPGAILLVAIAAGALLQEADGTDLVDTIGAEPPARRYLVVPLILGLVTLRSTLQTTAYVIAGNGRSTSRLGWAARIDPGSYPIRIALAQRLNCSEAKDDIVAVVSMAPNWPATINAARRCGVRIAR